MHQNNPILRCFLTKMIYSNDTMQVNWINNLRSLKKLSRLAKDKPNQLLWIYKQYPDSRLDNHTVYRLISREQSKKVTKGGWKVLDKISKQAV